jgi:pimeloyl-ACP methyl ester carboxylesterase
VLHCFPTPVEDTATLRGTSPPKEPPYYYSHRREIPASGKGPVAELTGRLEHGLEEHFRSKPVRIMWAMRDVAFTPQMLDNLWLRTFPTAEVTRLEDAGHFLQEDAHERIVPELLRFLAQPPDRTALDQSTLGR